MHGLFRSRSTRPSLPLPKRRRRPVSAQQQPCEPLEQRLVLAANLSSGLSEVTSISIDTDAAGPAPIVFEHVDLATTDAGVLVVKSVAHGYVQKWDAGTSSWIDITNEPVSGDPRDLLRFLAQRTFKAGDRLQWIPAGATGTVRAFDIINWSSDTTPPDNPDSPLPAAVSSISVSASSQPGTLAIDWTAPASGDATSYSVRIRSGDFSRTIDVAGTSATISDLAPLKAYAIDVWASNASGDGPVQTAFHTLLDNRTVGDQVTAWDIRRNELPPEPTDPQGNLQVPLGTPWGDRLGFPGVSYEAIWAATPDNPATVPSLDLPVSTLGTETGPISGGRTVSMWVQATGPGMLLSSTVEDANGVSVEVPYLWIDTDGNVNGGFYGSDEFEFNTGQTILSYQTITGNTIIGSPLAITSQVTVIDNNWHHVALATDGNTQSLYVDGLLQGSAKPTVIQKETGLVTSVYGNTITIPLEETPAPGETFTARLFQDDTFTINLRSTTPLSAVTPLSVSATNVMNPGSPYTPVRSATLFVPTKGTPYLELTTTDTVHNQNAMSAMLLYSNAAGSTLQLAPTDANAGTEITSYQVGTSVFTRSAGAMLPQVNYPQPFIGAVDDLAIWDSALSQADVQAVITAPVNTALNGVTLPSGTPLAPPPSPSFALNFSQPTTTSNDTVYTFSNDADNADSTLTANAVLLNVGVPATIPASPYSSDPTATNYLPRLGHFQNYGVGLMTPLDSGTIRIQRGSDYTAQVALAQGDLLTFSFDGGQPTTATLRITDEFGNVSSSIISTANPASMLAKYTGTFKVSIQLPATSLASRATVNYSHLPGSVNSLQPLLATHENRDAAYTTITSAYADPTLPTLNVTTNYNGYQPDLATGPANYFPLWTDTAYFPTSATTESDKQTYAQQLSTAYEQLVDANDGRSFADLSFQAVNDSAAIPEENRVALAAAYRIAFNQSPPTLPLNATSFTPSANDTPQDAVYKFFANVNQYREHVNTAILELASAISSIGPQQSPFDIATIIATNQAAFVGGQTDGIVSESDEEDLGNVAKESSIDLGIKATGKLAEEGAKSAMEEGTKEAAKGILISTGVGIGVEFALKMFTGWVKIRRTPEASTSSIYVSFVPVINAMTSFESLEDLANSISINNDDYIRQIKTQLTSPAFLQSVLSNYGLLKAMSGVSAAPVEDLAASGDLNRAAAEYASHQAWSSMVPAAFSWQPVTPSDLPAASIQNTADAYGWSETVQINSSNSENPSWTATGDFNGDGYPDVVLSNNGSGSTSSDTQNLLLLYAMPNLDGNGDAVGYNNGWTYTEVTEASGDYTKVIEFDESGETNTLPSGIAAADFNNDGKDDIIVNFVGSSNAAIWIGTSEVSSNGSLATPEYAGSFNLAGGTQPQQIVVADFNNDGWMDFASACADSGSVVVSINTTGLPEDTSFSGIGPAASNSAQNTLGELSFTTYNIDLKSAGNVNRIATGDLNGDGYPDLVWGGKNLGILLSTSSTTGWLGFGSAIQTSNKFNYGNPTGTSNSLAVGDFDGDGDASDIAFTQVTSVTTTNNGYTQTTNQTSIEVSFGSPADYYQTSSLSLPDLSSRTVTQTSNGSVYYPTVVALATIPAATIYGETVSSEAAAGGRDGLAVLESGSIAILPSLQDWVTAPTTSTDYIIELDGPTGGSYGSFAVSPSGMLAAASGSSNGTEHYSQVNWSNNVLANNPLAAFFPDDTAELNFITTSAANSTASLPAGYDSDDLVLAAIASLQAGTPSFTPITVNGIPSKIASPSFFLAAVPAMVNRNDTMIDGAGRVVYGWNLVDNNGNPIALETANELFGLVTPATAPSERGSDETLAPVLPQLWDPVNRVLQFNNPSQPLRAYNGMWYADVKTANSAVTSLAQAFFAWGRGDADYHDDGLVTSDGLATFPTITEGDYTVVLHPSAVPPPELFLPPPFGLTTSTSGTPATTTFSWTGPATLSSANVLYEVRVYDGQTGALITKAETTESSISISGLADPYLAYYTVTAAIPGATSAVAGYAPWIQGNDNVQPAVRENAFVGIATEGIPFVGGGLDGSGLTYSFPDLKQSLGYRGVDFSLLGSNTPNMVASTGQTINVDGAATDGTPYNVVYLAAAAVGRDLQDVEIVANLADGSTTTWTQSFSDWKAPANFAGESIIASMSTAISNNGIAIPFETLQTDGSVGPGTYQLYAYSFAVPAAATVESITLPNNQFLKVLDLKLSHVEQSQTSATWNEWNAFGITSGAKQVPNSQGFNGEGQYYNGDDLSSPLSHTLSDGKVIDIALGDTNNDGNTVNNFVSAQGQTINFTETDVVSIAIAAAYTNKYGDTSTSDVSIQVNFSDGTAESWDLTLYPWLYQNQGAPPTGHPLILSAMNNYRRQDGNESNDDYAYIYGYQYIASSAATIVSVTLPDNADLGILGLTVESLSDTSAGLSVAPPTAPTSVAATALSSVGDVTLSWGDPGNTGGAPITLYTATAWQGTFTQTVSTSGQSTTFTGLTEGNGPVYFTVTATNAAGTGTAGQLLATEAGVSLPLTNAGVGFSNDSSTYSTSGFDGDGNTFSWDAMGDSASGGGRVGNTLPWNGVVFDLGNPNQPNFTWANGQTVAVTGVGNILNLAAAAVNDNQESQAITLNFTDGTSAVWTQSISNWWFPQSYAGEQAISSQSYLNTSSGSQITHDNYIYGYSYALPSGSTLESVTFPTNADVRLIDMQLSTSTSVDISGSYNFWGIANGQTQAANNDGFDHNGHYYYSGDLPSSVTWSGATFDFGPTSTSKNGTNNFVQARGQIIDLSAGNYNWLYLAAAAANGSQLNQEFTLKFTDGSQATWTQSLSDWCDYESFDGQQIVHTQSNWVDQVGNVKSQTNRVYGYAYQIPAGKTLESITLPNNSDVGVLAISLL